MTALSLNPLTGQQNNSACESLVGEEYVNFAYLTHNGIPQGPPNPVQFQALASGTPDPHKVEFLNQGDTFTVTLHDTPSGLQAVVKDTTNGTSGSMTASAANGFGQVKYAPSPSTTCKNIPYNFHPMYATSTVADDRAVGSGDVQRGLRYGDRTLRLLQQRRRHDRYLRGQRGDQEQYRGVGLRRRGLLAGFGIRN